MQPQRVDPNYQNMPQKFNINNEGEVEQDPTYNNISVDQIKSYGGIISDLTDVEKVIEEFELRLQGKKRDKNGKIEDIQGALYKLHEATAAHLSSMLRGISNQNTHFTKYDSQIIYEILWSLNYRSQYWMMMQGDKIPVHLRGKIGFEMMCIAKASLYKANEGVILRWTKGSFGEQFNMGNRGMDGPKSWTDYLPFFGRKR